MHTFIPGSSKTLWSGMDWSWEGVISAILSLRYPVKINIIMILHPILANLDGSMLDVVT